jgi:uncharacterized RDD family membrane protein YckC
MKCPKCGYLGFEPADRCRNCGYEFSLSPSVSTPELTMRDGDAPDDHTLRDLPLIDTAAAPASGGTPIAGAPIFRTPPPPAELPLFGEAIVDDEPLITKASPPRQPLSVRRATPDVPKAPSSTPMLELGQESRSGGRARAARAHSAQSSDELLGSEFEAAAFVARAAAAAIDLTILAAIDVVVVYLTLKICGLTTTDLAVLPKAPLIAFLLVQNVGYLAAFTASGQTLGKMAAGIRVVPAQSDVPIDLGRAVVRAIVWVALVFPAGLGFLTALFGRERRGLHDRCAGTRVVRASA